SADKIFYLTAKTSGKKEAFGACARLYASGTRLRSIMITAKEQICPWQERFRLPTRTGPVCVRGECPLLEAGAEKWRGALHELLAGYHGFDKKTIRQTAAKWGVCPYELSLDLSEFCDAVICDYNYVFDKNVRFERYFDKKTSEKYVFLIDEAHNLPDRIRQTYSGQISLEGLMAFREEAQELPAELENGMSELLGVFTAAMDLCADSVHETGEGGRTGFWMSREMPVFLSDGVCNGYKIFSEWLRKNRGAACAPAVWRLVEAYRRFADLIQLYHTGFMTYVEILGDNVIIRLYCLDPTSIARESLSMAHASVLFSATLTPADYFKDILGGGEGAVSVSLPSPFPQDNLCVAAVTTISTRYEDRTKSADRIVSCIAATVSGKRGNYIVYLPSYAYLELVSGRFAKKYPKVTVTVQKQDMNAAQRDEFLGLFVENEQQLHIGFCVLGGLFAEGIDLPGSRLIGSIIVGTGLPGLSNEGNILRDYYQMKNEDGFNYAYTYPGMNRVLQAAGRVIRTEKDKGIVVLLDDRYATPLYRDMMPPHWSHIKFADSAASLADIVRRFWASKEEAQK
ncbi:MAG: ATP-dependent DNA helicase, partial [Clostridia bacterium]|nr:ATP-dependent DNA helicase [Clostridia bacterium]